MLTKEQFIEQAQAYDAVGGRCQDFANQILPFLLPPKKLKDLADSEEDCKKLLHHLAGYSRFRNVQKSESWFWIHGFAKLPFEESESTCTITVFHDGREIDLNNEGNILSFHLVKFFRELGYGI